jgi:chemotaxis protein methyltransferase CheR
VRLQHFQKYFRPVGEDHAIVQRLKDRVELSIYDLLDHRSNSPPASVFGDFDLVVCSNVLFYYRPDAWRFILDKLVRSLSPDGFLVLGEAERDMVGKATDLQPVIKPVAVYQKKVRSSR